MNTQEKQNKIEEYEHFIENTLRVDLKDIESALKGKFEKYKQWEELKEVIKLWQTMKDRDINLLVPIGCGVQVNAEADDPGRLLVDVGLGCHLDMNFVEADKYSSIRMKVLKKEIDHYRSLAVQVKVKIKLTLLAVNELRPI